MTSTESDPQNPEAQSRKKSPRWRALALLLAVFLLGAIVGFGSSGLWLRSRIRAAVTAPASAEGPAFHLIGRLEARLTRELSLTPGERAAVSEEFDLAAQEFLELRASAINEGKQIARDTLNRIERHLPPEKQQTLRTRAKRVLENWGVKVEPPDHAGS